MLELKLVKESLFLNVLKAILDLVDMASVDCSSTGLKLQAVDTEHAIIELLFPAEDFQHYHCDEYITMGIPIDDLVKAIRCADNDDTITIKRRITLRITICGLWMPIASASKSWIGSFWIPCTRPLSKCPLRSLCVYASTSATSAAGDGHISVTEKGLNFFASGKSGRVNIKYMQPEEATATTVVTMRAPVSLTLDLKYMNSFSKASTLFNQVKICLSTTQPLMVECKIGQMGYIRYFLAPKGSAEENEGSKEIKGSGEEKEGSKEIKGSREDKEGIKERERESEIEEEMGEIQKESKDRIG
uniref:Uncharacterized protein n=1 Tax=Avena sativa TaxID=4498 RepID=A0ACD5UPN3_AVESA